MNVLLGMNGYGTPVNLNRNPPAFLGGAGAEGKNYDYDYDYD
ncbi:MAG: hypothetical protein WCS52_01740 [bacterium]